MIASGPTLYISGQGPIDSKTVEFQQGPFREQAERVFQNITTLLEEAGTSWEHAVKVTVFLEDMNNFSILNEVYQQFAVEPYPARTTAQSNLGRAALSVDCIALVPEVGD